MTKFEKGQYKALVEQLQELTGNLAFNHMCLDVTACNDKEWRLKTDRLIINFIQKMQNLIEVANEIDSDADVQLFVFEDKESD